MPLDVAVVTVVGLGLIGWELWYFLVPPRRAAAAAGNPAQEFRVTVKNGFHPDTLLVEAGRPVRIHFYRDETAECSDRLVFEAAELNRPLPPFELVTVAFTPTEPGDYGFRCGEGVIRGRVVAQVGREAARLNLGRGHTKHG